MYYRKALCAQQENVDQGTLQITVHSKTDNRPVENALVRISYTGDPNSVIEEVRTDSSGNTPVLQLKTPPLEYSLNASEEAQPYAEYSMQIKAEDFHQEEIAGTEVLPAVLAKQPVLLNPRQDTVSENRIVIPPHTLFYEYPPKIQESEIKPVHETGEIVLSKVVIPEYIVVHDGPVGDNSASNYYVRYRDYIKNVASSEIYATWPDDTIRANILAIMSFTLNRVYTEWYRNKGKDYTITSSTAYDHKWIRGRNIFDSIDRIVDELFENYSELANTLGNLVNRTISMSNKYFGGVVENKGVTEPVDDDLKSFILSVPAKVDAKMEKLRVADAITEVFTIFKRCNKYIDETMPWALAKDESKQDRLATVLYNLVEGICIGTTLLESFMPNTTKRILGQLNASERTLEDLKTFGLYPSGNKVTDKPEILFARMDIKEVMEKVNELHPPKEEPKEEKPEEKVVDIEAKPEITFDDFAKLQFQVGEVIACEAVKKSKKLLCSQVKIGSQVRQIVSGIKAYYTPEEMVGKKVMVVTNLKPAKLAGILSEGMILCAEDAEGNVCVVSPEKNMPAGSEIC